MKDLDTRKAWKIVPVDGGGWWLFYEGKLPSGDASHEVWWHKYHDNAPVYPTLDAVFEKIKESSCQ